MTSRSSLLAFISLIAICCAPVGELAKLEKATATPLSEPGPIEAAASAKGFLSAMPCTRNYVVVKIADLPDMATNPRLYRGNCAIEAATMEFVSIGRHCVYTGGFFGHYHCWRRTVVTLHSANHSIRATWPGKMNKSLYREKCLRGYGWWHSEWGTWTLGLVEITPCR